VAQYSLICKSNQTTAQWRRKPTAPRKAKTCQSAVQLNEHSINVAETQPTSAEAKSNPVVVDSHIPF
jgi:hypothetical protein